MATLEGKNINATYQGLLKTFDNCTITGVNNVISDGEGNCTALSLGATGAGSTFDSSLVVKQFLRTCSNLTTDNDLCVKGIGTFDTNVNISGCTCTNTLTTGDIVTTGVNRFDNGINLCSFLTVSGCSNFTNTNIGGVLNVDGTATLCGGLTVAGPISSTGDIVAFYSSDNRLKDNLVPIDSFNYVNNLTGYEFDWNERSKRTGTGKGIIAQDLHKIDKSLVRENSEGYLSVDYISLIPILIEEVKRLSKEIELLKNKV